jgi:phage terminase small subunit
MLLAKSNVSARVAELDADVAVRLGLTQEWVLTNLKDVADKCMQAKEVEIYNRDTKQMEATGEYVFDSRGANRALELIGKHNGMFVDRIDHTTKGEAMRAEPTVQVIDQATAEAVRKVLSGE